MDHDTKRFLALILAELYRIQRQLNPKLAAGSDATIYALRNGFENVIDEQLEEVGFIVKDHVRIVADVLNRYFLDEDKLHQLKGYYDFERELENAGISRTQAIAIITWYNSKRQFTEVIRKLDSSNSPAECRTFEIPE